MATLQLSPEESDVLTRTLHWVLSESRMEIAATDLQEFRECLKDQKRQLEDILRQIESQMPE